VERPKLASPSLGQLLFRSVPSVASPLSLSLLLVRSCVSSLGSLWLLLYIRAGLRALAWLKAQLLLPRLRLAASPFDQLPPPADRLPPPAIAAARSSFLERAVQLQRGKVYLRLEISFMLLLLLVLDC
jgi:hypothetical protein